MTELSVGRKNDRASAEQSWESIAVIPDFLS